MPPLFIFLIKANVSLTLFYLAYRFVLRPLTFNNLNRSFLLLGMIFSCLYPFFNIADILRQHQTISHQLMILIPDWNTVEQAPMHTSHLSFWPILTLLFWSGMGCIALRLLLQILSLYKLHQQSRSAQLHGFRYRKINDLVHPFSFWQIIYLNPELHESKDIKTILLHEQIHVSEWHTLDVLAAEITTVLCWCNPVAWLVKFAVKENLEFITDQQMLLKGIDRKTYQYNLLRISGLSLSSSLVNHFNFLTIKKRITMMNKKQSSPKHIIKFAVLLPFVLTLCFACSFSIEEPDYKVIPDNVMLKLDTITRDDSFSTTPDNVTLKLDTITYYVDAKKVSSENAKKIDPNEIESMQVFKDKMAEKIFDGKAGKGVIVITTKANKNSPEVQEFNRKLNIAAQ